METPVNIDKMTKEQLLAEIVCNDNGLYEEYEEVRLLNDGYSEMELREIAISWIIKNNEAGWGEI